ncbi:PREDICTED: G-protein coupled receptor 39 [Eurypyga helias]|uniref:G-protein coupled receptor 39 n=1 Tax=Eurypyga helias TaxID=54383 RepID=UPI0005285B9A|nr:PREDICTED: G-protein coupled receptor 39 [Eurypyga helias]
MPVALNRAHPQTAGSLRSRSQQRKEGLPVKRQSAAGRKRVEATAAAPRAAAGAELIAFYASPTYAHFRLLLFAGLIVATLAVCWMPNQVRRIMAAAKPKQDWTVPYFRAYVTLLPIADIFFYLSSVVNPLLYNISSQQFRSVFLQVLRCRLTIQHANKERFLRANLSSTARSSRSLRPLLFMSSRRNSSTRGSNKVVLSTFQGESKPACGPQRPGLEPPAPSLDEAPLETGSEPHAGAQNGLCEHQV